MYSLMMSKAQSARRTARASDSVRISRGSTRRCVRIALTCNRAVKKIPSRTQATRTQTAVPLCGSVDRLREADECSLISKRTARVRKRAPLNLRVKFLAQPGVGQNVRLVLLPARGGDLNCGCRDVLLFRLEDRQLPTHRCKNSELGRG